MSKEKFQGNDDFLKPPEKITKLNPFIAVGDPDTMELLQFNISLADYINRQFGRQMTTSDLESKGFGVPHTSIDALKDGFVLPNSDVSMLEYLLYVQSITLRLVSDLENSEQR